MPPTDPSTAELPATGHFPDREELLRLQEGWGLHPALDPEAVAVRFDRHLATLEPRPGGPAGEVLVPADAARGFVVQLAGSLTRTRIDHRKLDQAGRDTFNQALQAAHASGDYQKLAAVHADMSHRMHSMNGPVGTQRFLPWHRRYLLEMENLLRSTQPAAGPSLTVPYWDYATDHARPDWVWQPPQVTRGVPGAAGGALPTQAVIDALLLRPRYTPFTSHLETDAHNQVHNWCNGTVSDIMHSPRDPIFWLLHANVDRIWDRWQLNHTAGPSLTPHDAILDPWASTAPQVAGTTALGYSYA
ncbi:tyrosinase family protein [Kitasatospora sp. NPDC002227]|uniref:tyrosinase family protein n=1 Tax=Kitasatospora sp. NPDC002227 TaxID=3154773 RepID=UPI00332E42F5